MELVEANFRQAALTMADVLRKRARGRRGQPIIDAAELTELRMTRGQLREIRLLGEEIISRWRTARQALQRLEAHLEAQERQFQHGILTPVEELGDAITAVYGAGEGG